MNSSRTVVKRLLSSGEAVVSSSKIKTPVGAHFVRPHLINRIYNSVRKMFNVKLHIMTAKIYFVTDLLFKVGLLFIKVINITLIDNK